MKNRLPQIDWLRAIGIFLVVYGHSLAVPPTLLKQIYAFHMPLFFFLSGFVLSKDKVRQSFPAFTRTISRALLPSYLIFAVIGYLSWFFVLRKFGNDNGAPVPPSRPLLGILYGSGTTRNLLQPLVLWFFPALFTSQLLLWSLIRLPQIFRLPAAVLSAGLGLLVQDAVLPLELESALLVLPFIWLGYELAQSTVLRAAIEKLPMLTAIPCFGVALWLAGVNSRVDIRTSHIGNPLLFYVTASLAVFSLYAIACRGSESTAIKRISAATLFIFPLHLLVFSALGATYVFILKISLATRENLWVGVVASTAIVAVLTLISPWWTKGFNHGMSAFFPATAIAIPADSNLASNKER